MTFRRPLFVTLVLVAILMVIAHVCVLPLRAEAHAQPVAPAVPSADEPHGDASCEAAMVAPTAVHAAPALVAMPMVVVESVRRLPLARASRPEAVASRSSPLFLVHLALLI